MSLLVFPVQLSMPPRYLKIYIVIGLNVIYVIFLIIIYKNIFV
jgi:hypothetical protein